MFFLSAGDTPITSRLFIFSKTSVPVLTTSPYLPNNGVAYNVCVKLIRYLFFLTLLIDPSICLIVFFLLEYYFSSPCTCFCFLRLVSTFLLDSSASLHPIFELLYHTFLSLLLRQDYTSNL